MNQWKVKDSSLTGHISCMELTIIVVLQLYTLYPGPRTRRIQGYDLGCGVEHLESCGRHTGSYVHSEKNVQHPQARSMSLLKMMTKVWKRCQPPLREGILVLTLFDETAPRRTSGPNESIMSKIRIKTKGDQCVTLLKHKNL